MAPTCPRTKPCAGISDNKATVSKRALVSCLSLLSVSITTSNRSRAAAPIRPPVSAISILPQRACLVATSRHRPAIGFPERRPTLPKRRCRALPPAIGPTTRRRRHAQTRALGETRGPYAVRADAPGSNNSSASLRISRMARPPFGRSDVKAAVRLPYHRLKTRNTSVPSAADPPARRLAAPHRPSPRRSPGPP